MSLVDFASKAYHACNTKNATGTLIRRAIDSGLHCSNQRLVGLHQEMLVLESESTSWTFDPERITLIQSKVSAEVRMFAQWLACVKS